MSSPSPSPSSSSTGWDDSNPETRGRALLEDCLAAIRGQRVPKEILAGTPANPLKIQAVIHGIRYHEGFAFSSDIVKVCALGMLAAVSRARSARQIMSNQIPDLNPNNLEAMPYCIWYPAVAEEETYRRLVERYPAMRYLAGRACAVAGYISLYRELDLLPDVSIAEEARDNGCHGIFDDIMSQPAKYIIMNDYSRTIHIEHCPSPAFLNGNTTVRSHLDRRISIERLIDSGSRYRITEGDITEDGRVDEETTDPFSIKIPPTSPDHTLLYSPLPTDLPRLRLNKDLLIIMSAYYGNIDRYSRLKRPTFVRHEVMCVVRGIYHNTLYARWWEGELQSGAARNNSWDVIPYVRAAISARYLMENNMHHLLAHDDYLPFQIWYPHPPDEMTLRELLALRPQMKHPVAHACMAGGYRTLWDELDIQPDKALREHARDCPNTYFRDEIERRIAAHQASARGSDGSNVKAWSSPPTDPRAQAFAGFQFEGSADVVVEGLTSRVVDTDWRAGPYDGLAVEAQMVALYVCAPEWLKRYAFLKDAGPVNILYWKSEDEMHKELEEDGDRDLSRKIKELSMQ